MTLGRAEGDLRSPDGAKRNPAGGVGSTSVPDCAALHPGYGAAASEETEESAELSLPP